MNKIKNILIDKIFCDFNSFLDISEENNFDKKILKNIIIYLYEQMDDLNEFKNHLYDILDNYINFSELTKVDEDKIFNYIVSFMKAEKMGKKIQILIEKYENNNNIINFKDFSDIIMENKIFMQNLAIEYILYKMKKAVTDRNNINSLMDEFDIKVFLGYYYEKEKEIKEDKKVRLEIKFRDGDK